MQHFQLKHPAEIADTYYCDHCCPEVADHLDVDDQGHEYRLCGRHKDPSVQHASRLPQREPNPSLPYRRQSDTGRPTIAAVRRHIEYLEESIRAQENVMGTTEGEHSDGNQRLRFLKAQLADEEAILRNLQRSRQQ